MQHLCIHHSHTDHLDIHQDYLTICDQDRAQAVMCSLLERLTNDLLATCPCDGGLWIEIDLPTLMEHSLHFYGRSTLQGALVALEERGFVETRYLKRDQGGNLLESIYETYHAAQQDDLVKGVIVKQYLFHCKRVQEAIAGGYQSQPRDRKNTSIPPLSTDTQTRGKLEESVRTHKPTLSCAQNQQGGC